MLQLIITILVGLATLACTQCFDNNKVQDHSLSEANEEDGNTDVKVLKRSTDCETTGWQDPKSDSDKRAWNNMQATWGKRKWQDMQNPGWGKRSPTPPEFDKDIQANLQTSFQEDKRGWRDMQGPSWGKRGWQDMRQPSWGKRGWKDMQASAWGKRGWQDMQGQWGKRGWQDMQGLNWGKRRWQDMQTSAWGKRGWKDMQASAWGKRDAAEDQAADKRGWGDMKISGYGKRAWNDIQSSGWGKRGWKEMQSTGWGKRSPQDHEDLEAFEDDWALPLKSELESGEAPLSAADWPLSKYIGASRNEWHQYEPLEDQALIGKILEGLHKSSWTNRNFNPKKQADGGEENEDDEHAVQEGMNEVAQDAQLLNAGHLRTLAKMAVQKACFVTMSYPFRFASTLVQLGYIPKQLATKTEVGGVQMYGIPSILEYMRYVRTDEGRSGLIRGEISYCWSVILYYFINHYVSLQLLKAQDADHPQTLYEECADVLWTTAVSSAAAVVITHPFAVLSLRQMSQFIGKENIYSSSVAALKHLLVQPGLFALIDGLLPRYVYLMVPALFSKVIVRIYDYYLAGHVSWFPPHSSSDVVASNIYYRSDWVKWFIGFAAEHCVSDMLYPLEVVLVSSSVAKSGVVPGEYPFTPEVSNWVARLMYMARHHQLRRRANLLKKVFTEHNDAFIVY